MAEPTVVTTDDRPPAETDAPVAAPQHAPIVEAPLVEADLLVEDVSIDGMCGVY